jgi:hypothetical protein
MSSIYYWDDVILFVDGQIAMHEDCCCEDEADELCAPCTFTPKTMTVTIGGVANCPLGVDCSDEMNRSWQLEQSYQEPAWEECGWACWNYCYMDGDCAEYYVIIDVLISDGRAVEPPYVYVRVYLQGIGEESAIFEKYIYVEDEESTIDCRNIGSVPLTGYTGQGIGGPCDGGAIQHDFSNITCTLSP